MTVAANHQMKWYASERTEVVATRNDHVGITCVHNPRIATRLDPRSASSKSVALQTSCSFAGGQSQRIGSCERISTGEMGVTDTNYRRVSLDQAERCFPKALAHCLEVLGDLHGEICRTDSLQRLQDLAKKFGIPWMGVSPKLACYDDRESCVLEVWQRC